MSDYKLKEKRVADMFNRAFNTDPLHAIFVTNDSASRKTAPVWAGFMRYFPRAMKAVAYLSWMGNQKHNPHSKTLGWSWNRSDDHGDCVARHQSEVGELDEYNLPHELAVAWRGMAQLEKYLVDKYNLELPPAAYMVSDSEESVPQPGEWDGGDRLNEIWEKRGEFADRRKELHESLEKAHNAIADQRPEWSTPAGRKECVRSDACCQATDGCKSLGQCMYQPYSHGKL